jgi:hypothetical protein
MSRRDFALIHSNIISLVTLSATIDNVGSVRWSSIQVMPLNGSAPPQSFWCMYGSSENGGMPTSISLNDFQTAFSNSLSLSENQNLTSAVGNLRAQVQLATTRCPPVVVADPRGCWVASLRMQTACIRLRRVTRKCLDFRKRWFAARKAILRSFDYLFNSNFRLLKPSSLPTPSP